MTRIIGFSFFSRLWRIKWLLQRFSSVSWLRRTPGDCLSTPTPSSSRRPPRTGTSHKGDSGRLVSYLDTSVRNTKNFFCKRLRGRNALLSVLYLPVLDLTFSSVFKWKTIYDKGYRPQPTEEIHSVENNQGNSEFSLEYYFNPQVPPASMCWNAFSQRQPTTSVLAPKIWSASPSGELDSSSQCLRGDRQRHRKLIFR